MFHAIQEAVDVLENPEQRPAAEVRRAYERWMQRFAEALKTPAGEAIRDWGEHFVKITQRYWPGLFHTYDVTGLPRTNNALEQLFGSLRHQERRITGHKVASPSLVVRGAVRVLAAVLTRVNPPTPLQLGEVDPVCWREERRRLGKLRQARVMQRRFRQHPDTYLAALEEKLLKLNLPP
ncbi:hypothetical protein G3480_26870 [Thiorhodococcus mannitoliphagus]|uniref:Uncharacterized protein n=1 Tax=Thiorhodococcus mannitoliphagus TaxID=329406 RepID=A0A6P1E768_9GAMM|nr:hypothetical protein [Thiorhodococcus mannitoliphagus]NEX23834.1 hypothetical protein [Thiorhodococcus mannitoliphagus]